MPLQTQLAAFGPDDAYKAIRGLAQTAKNIAQNDLAAMQAQSVTTDFIFQMLNQFQVFISNITAWKSVAGLDSYATSQGYVGTMSADCTTAISAAQACVNWVVANFPTDAANWLQAYRMNADGSRTPNSFTPAATAGLQTNLQSFIATIS